jgi:ABC-type uncharacterized transport system ATPase component
VHFPEVQVRSQREVVAKGVTVAGTHEPFVEGVDFTAPWRAVSVVPCDPGAAQVALALAVGGRVALAAGAITVGGSSERADLQVRTRLVDVADVTAPEGALALRAVIAEELALAERPSSRADVENYLADRDLTHLRQRRWESLPAGLRTRLLIELGSWHPRVRVLVLAGPDRHGGSVDEWFDAARQVADSGLTVIVLCSPATAAALPSLTTTGASA